MHQLRLSTPQHILVPAPHFEQVLQHCLFRDLLQQARAEAVREPQGSNGTSQRLAALHCTQQVATPYSAQAASQPARSGRPVHHTRGSMGAQALTQCSRPVHSAHELPPDRWQPPHHSQQRRRTTEFQCSVTARAMSSLVLVGCTPCTSYCLVYLRSVWTCTADGGARDGVHQGRLGSEGWESQAALGRTDMRQPHRGCSHSCGFSRHMGGDIKQGHGS